MGQSFASICAVGFVAFALDNAVVLLARKKVLRLSQNFPAAQKGTVHEGMALTERKPHSPATVQGVTKGNLSELYLSLQGEGLWVGIPMVFVRTTGCHRRCKYCDTEYALVAERKARLWLRWRTGDPDLMVDNPVPFGQVVEWVRQTASGLTSWVTFTGGEPLLQADFLAALGKALKERGFRILLETEGGLPEGLRKVLPVVDAIAADIKLPSTTGEPLDWQATETFFRLIAQSGKEACAKVVITPDIDESEFRQAVTMLAQLHAEHRQTLPLILQPVTPARFVTEPPSLALLLRLLALAHSHLPDVRIVPQVHKFVNLA